MKLINQRRHSRAELLTTVLLSLTLAVAGFSQTCPGCEVSQQTVTNADALLNLDDTQKADAETTHLLGGKTHSYIRYDALKLRNHR